MTAKKIEMLPVDSSNVSEAGYDKDNKTLAIKFSDGSIYHYTDVSRDTYDELMAAKSVGKYIHANIKGIYKHSKQ